MDQRTSAEDTAPPDSLDDDGDAKAKLSAEEEDNIDELTRLRAPVIYEVVRREGVEELQRPLTSLIVAGFTAGLGIGFSVLCQGLLKAHLPDTGSSILIEKFGYCVGFLIVVLARLQLFTENTITAVIPICANPTLKNFGAVMRLWSVVLVTNIVGTFVFAAFVVWSPVLSPEVAGAVADISAKILEFSPADLIVRGIGAGFLVAALVWILPNAEAGKVLMIVILTYIIAVADFAHVVAGSAEAWITVLNGDASFTRAFAGYVVPTLIGNLIGGTGLFTFLAYTQVASELGETPDR